MIRGVARTSEAIRIALLPRRDWTTTADELADLLTEELKTPEGQMSLWPVQAAALAEIVDCKGLFAPIAVGKGKALVSLLAPVLLGAKRPLLIVPAQLREQTRLNVIPEMSKHWKLHSNQVVIGYSEFSTASKADLLEKLSPDVIVLDEAHYLKNAAAARTRRFKRYISKNPETRVVALSGTMTRRSLRDYWALLLWTLGKNAPLPRHWRELQDWADALDDGVDFDSRLAPGVLGSSLFCEPGESARDGFRRRLVQSPGVIATSDEELGTSLRIRELIAKPPIEVEAALARLRNTWETPNGDPIVEAVDLWRHARELALGFWYRWDPPPPKDWLAARKAWKRFVRDTITRSRKLDSELQVWNQCQVENELAPQVWQDWHEIKDSFEPNPIADWISDFALDAVTNWVDQVGEALIWVEHIAFGEALSKATTLPYFGAGSQAAVDLLDARGPLILSIAAHSEGKNLQRYSKNLVTSPPSSGKRWEQLLGRTHRPGQLADEVEVDIFLFAEEQKESLKKAMSEAVYIQETIGARQKLLYADRSFSDLSFVG